MLADNRRGIFAGKVNGFYYTGIGAFFALYAFFFIEENTATLPFP